MSILDKYMDHFVKQYTNFPEGRYINIIVTRKTESETVFRTEGGGEPLVKDFVRMGSKENLNILARSVISKRKQTAVERRTGREILRRYNLLGNYSNKNKKECTLNTNSPCGRCPDCMIYGYAVSIGDGGAQKSRVITEDAFSILPANQIIETRTFNAIYENGTMRQKKEDSDKAEASRSLQTMEYIKPETHYVDIEVLKDVTKEDFIYVLSNILRSTRYGAMTSKIGRVSNSIISVIFSDTEIFSTLELTQDIYDQLFVKYKGEIDFPLNDNDVSEFTSMSTTKLLKEKVWGACKVMSSEELESLKTEIKAIYQDPEAFLKNLYNSYEVIK